MADFVSALALKSGIEVAMAQDGLGALLTTLHKHAPAEVYARVASAIPDASRMLSNFQATQASAKPGMPSSHAGSAGGFVISKYEALSALVSYFSKAGFSLETTKVFLPIVLNHLRKQASADTVRQIEQAIPGLANLLKASAARGMIGNISKLFK